MMRWSRAAARSRTIGTTCGPICDLGAVIGETVGWVHRGFKREVDDLWPRLEQALVNNTRTLWFTGHSLGGAMAAICAGRCTLSYIRSNPRGTVTRSAARASATGGT